jgi:adenylyltransferase/sulfurtransferase
MWLIICQRQPLPKKRLRLINSSVQVTGIVADVTAEKALELAEKASLIVGADR